MYCVSGVTGTTGTTFYTQHKKIDSPKEFGHAVDKDQSEYKLKWAVAASCHLQDYMNAISHKQSKWEDI